MRGLFASPLGFLIGVSLGALGAGGSILAVPALVYGAGQDVRTATTTSLLVVGTAALIGMGAHYRAGRARVATGLLFGACGAGGALAGSALNRRLDPDLLLLAFSGLILVAAWRMFVGCPTCTRVGEQRALEGENASGAPVSMRRRVGLVTILEVLGAGTVVGFMAGLFGVGGGFVIVPALALVLRLPMPEAIGTSLLVIAINSGVALVPRLEAGAIDWAIAVSFTLMAVAGVLAGKRIADRLDPTRSLHAFAVLLVAVACFTAASSIAALLG